MDQATPVPLLKSAHLPRMKRPDMRIGLLGGSFNPAHEGHIHISRLAQHVADLDEVWWLVTPQNPLKSTAETQPYDKRVAYARTLVKAIPAIKVVDLTPAVTSLYTYDTVIYLQKRRPYAKLVLIMGADNLAQLSSWYQWRSLMQLIPLVVIDREPYTHHALTSEAAIEHTRAKSNFFPSRQEPFPVPPFWVFVTGSTSPYSSTSIRNKQGFTL